MLSMPFCRDLPKVVAWAALCLLHPKISKLDKLSRLYRVSVCPLTSYFSRQPSEVAASSSKQTNWMEKLTGSSGRLFHSLKDRKMSFWCIMMAITFSRTLPTTKSTNSWANTSAIPESKTKKACPWRTPSGPILCWLVQVTSWVWSCILVLRQEWL